MNVVDGSGPVLKGIGVDFDGWSQRGRNAGTNNCFLKYRDKCLEI